MSVIIRLQNLPWSANALDIRNFFRGLSIPEGGVHIVGGEQGDAFIAFSTDEDARQAMMHDLGKIKEVQVKLLLSSRSEMHKVIEAARQSVPLLQLQPLAVAAPAPAMPAPAAPAAPPALAPFAPALSHLLGRTAAAIPGLGSPDEPPPQPAVIRVPSPALASPADPPAPPLISGDDKARERDKKKTERRRSRSKSRDRDKKERRGERGERDKKERRGERSRSRDRSPRDRRRRSRSRDRRDRKRDRKERSRSRERSRDNDSRRSRDKRNDDSNHSASGAAPVRKEGLLGDNPYQASFMAAPGAAAAGGAMSGGVMPGAMPGGVMPGAMPGGVMPGFPLGGMMPGGMLARPFAAFGQAGNVGNGSPAAEERFANGNGGAAADTEALARLQELGNKRNPNAFQGPGWRPPGEQAPPPLAGGRYGREPRPSRFERLPAAGCCVRLDNVPTNTGYGDVRRFFGGHYVATNGIKMINDKSGRRSGAVVVKFSDAKGKQVAMARDGDELREQRVRIRHIDDAEYDAEVDSYLPVHEEPAGPGAAPAGAAAAPAAPAAAHTVLRLTELPNYVKEHDIIKKFSEYSLLSINLMDCRKTRTRTAYVQFVKPEDVQLALERRDMYAFGRKPVDVTPCSDADYERAKNEYSGGGVVTIDDDEGEEEAAAAAARAEEAPRDPRQRRPLPEAAGDAAPPAPSMFPHAAGFPLPRPPAGYPGAPPHFLPPAAFPGAFPPPMARFAAADAPLDCVLVKGLSSRATDRTVIDFFSEASVVPSRIHLMLDQSGRPSGDCFCEFRTAEEAGAAAARRSAVLEGREVSIELVERSVVEEALEGPRSDPPDEPFRPGPPFHPRGGFHPRGAFFRGRGGFERGAPRGRGGFERGGPRGRGYPRGAPRGFPRGGFGNAYNGGGAAEAEPEPAEPEGFGQPGCVVSLQNVPFRAGIEEILEFFGNFELSQDDVIRRFNENGMPTSDARVCFRTPFDAQRAVKTLNRQQIRDRSVFLQIV